MLFRLFPRLFGRRARAIFRYWNGQREVAADPFEITRAIENDPAFNPEIDYALVDAGDSAAILRTVNCVRQAFKVKSFNEGGLLESECLDLMIAFLDFLGSLKKSTSPPPTSSPPTESASSAQGHSPTSSSSDSPKTPSEANYDSRPG